MRPPPLLTVSLLAFFASSAIAQTGMPLYKAEEQARSAGTARVREGEKTILQVFADGNIRKPVSEALGQAVSTDDGPADGVVRLGVARIDATKHETWSGLITVASTLQRVQQNFVSTVLTPGIGSGFHSGLLEFRKQRPKLKGLAKGLVSDLHYYGTVAVSEWDSAGSSTKAVVFGLGILRVLDLIDGKLGGAHVGMGVEFGPCARFIGGDVTLVRHRQFLAEKLGTRDRNFAGIEVGLQIHVNEITAGLHLYRFAKGSTEVPGLTHAQVTAGVNVRAPLFSGPADQ